MARERNRIPKGVLRALDQGYATWVRSVAKAWIESGKWGEELLAWNTVNLLEVYADLVHNRAQEEAPVGTSSEEEVLLGVLRQRRDVFLFVHGRLAKRWEEQEARYQEAQSLGDEPSRVLRPNSYLAEDLWELWVKGSLPGGVPMRFFFVDCPPSRHFAQTQLGKKRGWVVLDSRELAEWLDASAQAHRVSAAHRFSEIVEEWAAAQIPGEASVQEMPVPLGAGRFGPKEKFRRDLSFTERSLERIAEVMTRMRRTRAHLCQSILEGHVYPQGRERGQRSPEPV